MSKLLEVSTFLVFLGTIKRFVYLPESVAPYFLRAILWIYRCGALPLHFRKVLFFQGDKFIHGSEGCPKKMSVSLTFVFDFSSPVGFPINNKNFESNNRVHTLGAILLDSSCFSRKLDLLCCLSISGMKCSQYRL